ncbi:MAG: hypothetical protein RL308_2201 [Bacteroidota bacterium]|jgi:hypothetical protein
MKTAMQTLLEDIEFLMPQTYKSLNKKFELKTFYLEKEKQQIIEAAETGSNSLHFKTKDAIYGNTYFENKFCKEIPKRTTTEETSFEPNV